MPPQAPNAPVEVPAPVQALPPTPQPAPAKGGFPKWLLFVIIGIASFFILIIIMVVVIFKVVNSSTAAPVAVGDKLLSSIQADDSSAVYALTTDSFKTATNESDTKSLVDGISSDLKGNSTITDRKIETSNGQSLAAIVYKVNGTSDDSVYLRVVLEKSGSDWKVVNFRTSKTALDATIEWMGLFVREQNSNIEQPLYSVGLSKTILIVGLGNIGKEYDLTRHNVGFASLDHFATQNDFPAWTNKKDLKCHLSAHNLGQTRVILCKPSTFMNNSGEAVQAVQRFYKVAYSDTVIVHDEIDIPFGQIRLRTGGGSAGHNGVKSVSALAGENTGRVRIGIANDFSDQADSADFVLGKFTAAEQKNLPALCQEVNAILIEYIYGGSLPIDTRNFIV